MEEGQLTKIAKDGHICVVEFIFDTIVYVVLFSSNYLQSIKHTKATILPIIKKLKLM